MCFLSNIQYFIVNRELEVVSKFHFIVNSEVEVVSQFYLIVNREIEEVSKFHFIVNREIEVVSLLSRFIESGYASSISILFTSLGGSYSSINNSVKV